MGDRPFALFVLNVVGQALLYTWLYLGTGGSALLAILFHAVGNTPATLIGATIPAAADPRVYLYVTALTWVLGLALLLRRKPDLAPAPALEL